MGQNGATRQCCGQAQRHKISCAKAWRPTRRLRNSAAYPGRQSDFGRSNLAPKQLARNTSRSCGGTRCVRTDRRTPLTNPQLLHGPRDRHPYTKAESASRNLGSRGLGSRNLGSGNLGGFPPRSKTARPPLSRTAPQKGQRGMTRGFYGGLAAVSGIDNLSVSVYSPIRFSNKGELHQ